MKIIVTQQAVAWFEQEWGFRTGDFVRIFVRYGGHSTVHEAYSLGITREEPKEMAASTTERGITFYMEQDDLWYLNEKDLRIDVQPGTDEISFLLT